MRIFEYKQRFYVDRDLIKALDKDGISLDKINEIVAFFCLLCYKDKPIYEHKDFTVQLIGGTYDEGLYVLNNSYFLTQDMLEYILLHKHKTQNELEHLMCRAFLGEEVRIDDKHFIRYDPPQIDYREVLTIINDHLNEDKNTRLLRLVQTEMDKQKERQEALDEVDYIKALLGRATTLPAPLFEEPPWPQHPSDTKEWPYYYPTLNPDNVYFHTQDESEHYNLNIEEELE